ncbi:putative 6-phosphogluconolactonase 1 isoform X1 [Apium graveolens]|uniref:putative 6-phosphogluconolactonase 1 isoform X1 n=1 Tax=Apium graveolens TaxID=4045 RepID=UPI003D795FE6
MAFSGAEKEGKEVKIYENLDDLKIDLAEYVAELSEAAVKERGTFSVALSGGSLIGLMGRELRHPPYIETLDWALWHIFWADERVVPKNHPDSNYKLAKDNLLPKVLVLPSQMHSINDSLSAKEASEGYEFLIRQLVKTRLVGVSETSDCPKFDLILLGMGSDGHVASLFPNHSVLDNTEDWVTYVTDSPKPPPERITFTMPVINAAANVVVVAIGSSKADAVHLAIDDVGHECPSLPAKMVKPTNGKLTWFLDKLAASKLDSCAHKSE